MSLQFVEHLLGSLFLCRYGMTENCASCTRTLPGDPTSTGTVGPPQPSVEIKLVDVPSLGYSAEDLPNPRGEVCVRSQNCFKYYYKGMPLRVSY
jgi:long-chain acyl-CoA synthetase